MSLWLYYAPQNEYLEGEHDTPMIESCLTFLATLINVRTNLGEFHLFGNLKHTSFRQHIQLK